MYYHPLFHRDSPEKLSQLRRRTCPGFDGRRNKVDTSPLPLPRYSYEEELEATKVSPASATGVKVSRSPSPTSSTGGGQPVGKGSVRSSTRIGGSALKSLVSMSEEEVSPVTSKKLDDRRPSVTATMVTPAPSASNFHRTISTKKMVAPTEESEKYVFDKLNSHQSISLLDGACSASANSNSDSDEDDFHYYTTSNRKKITKEELEELQDHRYEVSLVSRNLDGICSDYAESMKPRGRRGGRVATGSSAYSSFQFGLDKPDNAYSGTKCDLFTYDYEEGEYIVEEDHRHALLSTKEEEVHEPTPVVSSVRPPSPSPSPLLNGRIAQSCLDGYTFMPNTTMLERTVASAILSFCLATHPHDPDADVKLRAHLQRGPMLAKEFDMYLMALLPSIDIAPKDRLHAWNSFSLNKLQHIIKTLHDTCAPSSDERDAIKKCADCWFPELSL